MSKKLENIMLNFKRYFWVYASVFLILISSCSIKGSIKNFINTPVKSSVGINKAMHTISTLNKDNCASYTDSDSQILQKSSLDLGDLLPTIFLAIGLLALYYVLFGYPKQKHPNYPSARKIRFSVPLFLEYQKIITYC
ncbi:hypothetical protein [Myroides sp. LJL119]